MCTMRCDATNRMRSIQWRNNAMWKIQKENKEPPNDRIMRHSHSNFQCDPFWVRLNFNSLRWPERRCGIFALSLLYLIKWKTKPTQHNYNNNNENAFFCTQPSSSSVQYLVARCDVRCLLMFDVFQNDLIVLCVCEFDSSSFSCLSSRSFNNDLHKIQCLSLGVCFILFRWLIHLLFVLLWIRC